RPCLSWAVKSAQRGQRQTAYQILVAADKKNLTPTRADLWNSGKVASSDSIQITYAGKPLGSGMRCFWKVRSWDRHGKASDWSPVAEWSMGLLKRSDWKGKWIADPELAAFPDKHAPEPAAMLRKTFRLRKAVARATVYATAAGVYDLQINGQSVANHILAPEWTNYEQRFQYQTSDVTALLTKGDNAIGARLAEGWYAGPIGGNQFPGRHHYGPYPMLLAQLEIEFKDGSREIVASDRTWRSTTTGPIRMSDVFNGETYDARREMPGWDSGNFNDSGWQPVCTDPIHRGVLLTSQPNEPIQVTQELTPIGLTEPEPGTYIFDMGQNMAGWCRLRVHGAAGTSVKLRHSELVDPDGKLYTTNLEGALQLDRYIKRGDGEEVYEPHFTYHGFRYVELTGLSYKPKINAITGCVFHSAAVETGSFECSSKQINQLMDNILWTQRGNMHGIPTDCPQRGERRGWLGDIQAFAQTACFNMDMAAFFSKFVRDVRDRQLPDGRYPNFTPRPETFIYEEKDGDTAGYGVPAWADAGTIVPWHTYVNFGDRRMIEEHFESARQWVDWVHDQNPNLLWLNGRTRDYGDWLNSDEFQGNEEPLIRGAVPHEILATAFFAHSTEIVAKMSRTLGRTELAAQYAERFADIKTAFNRAFVDADGRIDKDTQAGYALALAFELVDGETREQAAKHLVRTVTKDTGHLSTGIQTTHRAMLALTQNGFHKEACRLINLRSFPSWGYMIDQDATTVWERWDGIVPGHGPHISLMNSFNHWALGSVGEWVWRHLAGINPDEDQPGFAHVVIRPRPGRKIDWVEASYESVRGKIAVEWHLENGRFTMNLTIPANTTATVFVPATTAAKVKEGGKPAAKARGLDFLRSEDGCAVFAAQSGRYSFQSR
ncbi:MAG: glycoside hydrolase family 78 protein, partial [Lentisphaeria bacterium]|nr:glycoside hydrolase family 78 protein [Lentisphaeria bacterium]